MKAFIILALISSSWAHAAVTSLACDSKDHKVIVQYSGPVDISVTYKGETALADGVVTSEEIDLVARFKIHGELSLFAKIGKEDSANYLFLAKKRNSVFCR